LAIVLGKVTVYESSDGGTGDPAKTFWQFFIGNQPVTTTNPFLAETVRLALETNSELQATYDPAKANVLSQVRIAFQYACETRRLTECKPQTSG
jgi:hypothetical protein